MSTKDVLSILFERGNAMQAFWGFYISIALGLLAFFGSGARSIRVALLASLAFVAFATVNCSGMHAIAGQRVVLFDVFERMQPSFEGNGRNSIPLPSELRQALVDSSRPPSPSGVVTFHVIADLAILTVIWVLSLIPRAK